MLLGFVSCGSDSSGTGGGATSSSITGKFVDDPVAGLKYVTDGVTAFTNGSGEFLCDTGDSVQFYVGNLLIGSANCGEVLTPLDIRGTQILTDDTVENVALLLQNLDDGSTGGLITIPEAYHDEDFSGLNLSEAVDGTFITALNSVTNVPAATVLTKAAAQTTLKASLSTNFSNKKIAFSFTTDNNCDAMDGIVVSSNFTLDTSGGADNWTFGGGNLTVNGSVFPLIESASASVGVSTLSFTNNLLAFYQGGSSPNTDLAGDAWLCANDSSGAAQLTVFTGVIELTFTGSNGGTGVLKEKFTCSGTPSTNTCGTFNFTVE